MVNSRPLMRTFLLLLLLALPGFAQEIKSIDWTQADDGTWKGRLNLTAPAPAAGVKVFFEPTFHFQLPESVTVPAGQTGIDFPLKLVDNAFLQGFTGIPERGFPGSEVSALCGGKLWTGPGPDRSRL